MFQYGIDHAMLVVHDLNYARAVFQQLGFVVSPRASHDHTRTENHLLILADDYIELLSVPVPTPANGAFQKNAQTW